MIQRGDYIISDLASGWVMARVRSNGMPCLSVLDDTGVVHLVPELRAQPAAPPGNGQRRAAVKLVTINGVRI